MKEGNIIYFEPFYFKNGRPPKTKYFVILKITDGKTILASLPTRKDHIPQQYVIKDGCVEVPDADFNCFVISTETEVTECGKKFDFQTHLYGSEIDDYGVDYMKKTYPYENFNYTIWGKMKSDLFNSLIECFKNSKAVKFKYRKIL